MEKTIIREAARHLVAISKKDCRLTDQSLNDWYLAEKKDCPAFSEKYPMNGELKEQEEEIDNPDCNRERV